MNNSFLAIQNVSLAEDEKQANLPVLRARETELNAIIEAVIRLANNPDWKLLTEKIWSGVIEHLKKQRDLEVEKQPLNGPKIHSLNGQLAWAKKYSNILELASIYKQELDHVRKTINAESKRSRADD